MCACLSIYISNLTLYIKAYQLMDEACFCCTHRTQLLKELHLSLDEVGRGGSNVGRGMTFGRINALIPLRWIQNVPMTLWCSSWHARFHHFTMSWYVLLILRHPHKRPQTTSERTSKCLRLHEVEVDVKPNAMWFRFDAYSVVSSNLTDLHVTTNDSTILNIWHGYIYIYLMHSALGRLGVHKSFIVDVTTHFGSSIPSPKLLWLFLSDWSIQ